jgi:hypothetical protein
MSLGLLFALVATAAAAQDAAALKRGEAYMR